MQQDLIAKNWREFIRPRRLELEEETSHYGRFACEPLERGFGVTLGNALRRVQGERHCKYLRLLFLPHL